MPRPSLGLESSRDRRDRRDDMREMGRGLLGGSNARSHTYGDEHLNPLTASTSSSDSGSTTSDAIHHRRNASGGVSPHHHHHHQPPTRNSPNYPFLNNASASASSSSRTLNALAPSGPSAAFLQRNDPSARGDVDDAVRLRGHHTEFAPTQLSMYNNYSTTSLAGPSSSSTNLLAPPLGRSGSVSSTRTTDSDYSNPFNPASSSSSKPQQHHGGTNALKKERPRTRYEDFLSGQDKLQTHSHSHVYDIMPDIELLNNDLPEKDDAFHDPGKMAPRFGPDRRIGEPKDYRRTANPFSARGLLNAGSLVLIMCALIGMFAAYPIIDYVLQSSNQLSFVNATGQIPDIQGYRGLIDKDTPQTAMKRTGFDGEEYSLVFSDEFEQDGRTFWPGDDPYWTAVDSHYYATNNLEYYDPRGASTGDGYLLLNFTRQDPRTNHGFNFSSGMIQTWNQFCFTGGYIEVAVNLPGRPDVVGFWPGAWTMGNLGRAGYGATNEGVWPYSYDSCDVGTLPNQTDPATDGPAAAKWQPTQYDAGLSYLPGQKYSSCTCKGEDHPGPWLDKEDRYRGRAAPEIDILEATVERNADGDLEGTVSMSAQFAPFDAEYEWNEVQPAGYEIWEDNFNAHINAYKGGVFQQAVSALPSTDQQSYELLDPTRMQTYGFEYQPSMYGDGFITWQMGGERIWSLKEAGMQANNLTMVSQRPISNEPMYAILNLGMSPQFGVPDFENLILPAQMRVDYVRIYQRTNQINVGCDPPGYPTTEYIDKHIEAYTNGNMTIWSDYTDAGFPKNRLIDDC